MGMVQYKVGKSWEDEVMSYYNRYGFSTLKLPTDLDGTVFDIIAMKGNKAICIECKHIKGNKLYFESSGLKRKRDEIDNFVCNGNNVVLFVKSDKEGTFIINWDDAYPIFIDRGFITKEDCIEVKL